MLIGNKSDLEKNRQVSREEAEKFAQDNDLFFLEASAKSADNVEQAFEKTAEAIQRKIQNGTIDMNSEVNRIHCGGDLLTGFVRRMVWNWLLLKVDPPYLQLIPHPAVVVVVEQIPPD